MAQNLSVAGVPFSARMIRLPKAVDRRLQSLLDRQDRGEKLTADERNEADALVELAEMLTLLRLDRMRENHDEKELDESADLYSQVYYEDEDLRELTELALMEIVDD